MIALFNFIILLISVIAKFLLVVLLIGLVLLTILLAILLFIPIKYEVKASVSETGKKYEVRAKATWFLKLLKGSAEYVEGQLEYQLKLLWYILYPEVEKQDGLFTKGKKEIFKKKQAMNGRFIALKNKMFYKKLKRKEVPNIKGSKVAEISTTKEYEFKGKSKEIQELLEIGYELLNAVQDVSDEEIIEKATIKEKIECFKQKIHYKNITNQIKILFINLYNKIKDMYLSYKNKIKKLFKNLKNIKYKLVHTCDMIKRVIKGKDTIVSFFEVNMHKKTLQHVIKELKFIYLHSKPKEVNVSGKFGLEDPANTGKALGLLGMLLPIIGEYNIDLEPYFEEEIIEVDLYISGKVYLHHFVQAFYRIIREKENRRTFSNIKRIKF